MHSKARVFKCGSTLLTNKQLRTFLATCYSCLFRGGHAFVYWSGTELIVWHVKLNWLALKKNIF